MNVQKCSLNTPQCKKPSSDTPVGNASIRVIFIFNLERVGLCFL